MDKYIGKLLDNRYEILEILGVGGMAIVYKARDRILDRFVAIKIMKDEFTNDEEFRRRFHNESQAVAKLSHNNIVSIYDVSQGSSIQYLVMELIEGITLKDYLRRKGSLNWQETLFFSQQISKALSHAHGRGIIHQDIKPHNIILLRDGTVKVTDFGIARFEKNQETRVIQEAIGSVHYISPEQAKGSRIDHRADLYSLGIVMYEMLSGHVPFDGDTPLAIVMQHISAKVPLPSELVPGIPAGMDDIVLRAMCPVLSKRYESANDIFNDLERLKNNPNLRFSSAGIEARLPNSGAMDETMAIPHVSRIQMKDDDDPAPIQQQSYERFSQQYAQQPSHTSKTAYRGTHGSNEDVEDMPRRRGKKKKKLSDSPAAMAGIAVAVFALIAFGVAIFMISAGNIFSNKTSVPNLVGMQLTDALNQYGTTFQIIQSGTKDDDAAQDGQILEQDLKAGSTVRNGETIRVVICKKQTDFTIPEMEEETIQIQIPIIGEPYETVKIELETLGLEVGIEEENSSEVEKGHIIRTLPNFDSEFVKGEKITLYVSSGVEVVTVPTVIGDLYSQAKTTLEAKHLRVSAKMQDSEQPKDTVLEQSVAGGENVDANTEIVLTISSGKKVEEPKPEPEPQPITPEVPDHEIQQDPEKEGVTQEQPPTEQQQPVQEQQGTASVSIPLDMDKISSVTVSMDSATIFNKQCNPDDQNPVVVPVEGPVGTSKEITISVNGKTTTQTVTFY